MSEISQGLRERRSTLISILVGSERLDSYSHKEQEKFTYNALLGIDKPTEKLLAEYTEYIGEVIIDMIDKLYDGKRTSFPRDFFKGPQGRCNARYALYILLEERLEWNYEKIHELPSAELLKEHKLHGILREYDSIEDAVFDAFPLAKKIELKTAVHEEKPAPVRKPRPRPVQENGIRGEFARKYPTFLGKLTASLHSYRKAGLDPEELAAGGLEKAFRKLDGFKGNANLYTWTYRIVNNYAIDEKRRACHSREVMIGDSDVIGAIAKPIGVGTLPGVEDAVYARDSNTILGQIESLFRKMNPDQVETMLLRADKAPYKEIAENMEVAQGTVMSRLHYGRRKLKELIEEDRLLSNNPGVLRVLRDLNER
jgi:RNA polymerase sigma-70 factor, ECF subfamily